jgi:hypothetical protein
VSVCLFDCLFVLLLLLYRWRVVFCDASLFVFVCFSSRSINTSEQKITEKKQKAANENTKIRRRDDVLIDCHQRLNRAAQRRKAARRADD